jgi:hypothetical protein
MKTIFNFTIFLLLGLVISSCQEASFTEVIPTPPNDLWYTAEPSLSLSGKIRDDHNGGRNPLPADARIVVAWEIPNSSPRLLYIYGTGTIANLGNSSYFFKVNIGDTLPKFVLANTDTTNAIAAAHIFLVGDPAIKTGDTLRYEIDWDYRYQMLGGLNYIGVIFVKGSPVLAGRSPKGTKPGFNLLLATWVDQKKQSVIDFLPADARNIEIQVDDDGSSCKKNTPFWLP